MEGDAAVEAQKNAAKYFNPLPPHGGRRAADSAYTRAVANFNPLPPHGGRRGVPEEFSVKVQFQSTPSAWRETMTIHGELVIHTISIHSLRMEGDVESRCIFL